MGEDTMILKGTKLWFSIFSLHRSPRYWDDPEEFRPERFLGDYNKVRLVCVCVCVCVCVFVCVRGEMIVFTSFVVVGECKDGGRGFFSHCTYLHAITLTHRMPFCRFRAGAGRALASGLPRVRP